MYDSELSQLFNQGPEGEKNNCAMFAAVVSADGAHLSASGESSAHGYPLRL